jgi:acyl-CoA synthetase (AMP-forming)/AMP-acid ligase II
MSNLRTLTFFDVYKKNADYHGDACAVHFNGGNTSHADLFSQTACFASGLKSYGLSRGSRIAVLCKNHPVFFHLFGAASALNLVLVLINRRLNPDEMAHIVSDTTPEMIICDREMDQPADQLIQASESLTRKIVVDSSDESFQALYTHPPIEPTVDIKDTDPFIIIHTAAVMGTPRGAVLSQSNVMLSNQQIIQAYRLGPTKAYLNILPLFHIMGVNLGLGALQAGGKNVIQEKFEPRQALALIESQQINLFGSFPPIISSLIEAQDNQPHDLSSLETTTGLEAPDTARSWEEISGCRFWTLYGQTETSGIVTTAPYFERSGSAGKIVDLADVRTADDNDQLLGADATGEILVKGPLVFQGYWNEDELNAHTFRNNWHHTGDLGMIDSDGFLFFKGRKPEKELIKPGGENVFPAEVEQTILAHEAVKETCVFGVPDKKFGEGIKAVCTLHTGSSLTGQELIAFCGERIAGYKKPRYVEFIDAMPTTDDGRIDRDAIKKTYT